MKVYPVPVSARKTNEVRPIKGGVAFVPVSGCEGGVSLLAISLTKGGVASVPIYCSEGGWAYVTINPNKGSMASERQSTKVMAFLLMYPRDGGMVSV